MLFNIYIYIYMFRRKVNIYLSRTNVSFLLKKYTINLMNHITIIFYTYFTIGIIQKLPQYKQWITRKKYDRPEELIIEQESRLNWFKVLKLCKN